MRGMFLVSIMGLLTTCCWLTSWGESGNQGRTAKGSGARVHASGSAADGQVVFQHACVMCHAVQPGVKIVGPSLASVMRGPHAVPAGTVRGIIVNGKGKMPAARGRLSDKEIADVLAYLKTL